MNRLFRFEHSLPRALTWADGLVLLGVTVLLYIGARLALGAPAVVQGPAISLQPAALPWYTALSVGRMAAAYTVSVVFTLIYGYWAAYNRRAEKFLLPLLDILQSVPILSFLPVALLGFSAILPEGMAVELAAIVLIFTSQVWNLTFAWYQALTTIPKELREASAIFRFSSWLRFKTLELPFAANSLIWNSVMSWAGGWFFLMAAEIFNVGQRDFRLPGLGAYLHEAANQQNLPAMAWGVGTLVLVIVLLDQLVWRPLLAWADRFSLSMVGGDRPPTSWFYDLLSSSALANWLIKRVGQPLLEWVDSRLPPLSPPLEGGPEGGRPWLWSILIGLGGLGLLYGAYRAGLMLLSLPAKAWLSIGVGVGATLLRVLAALAITLAWTLPVGVAIGTNRRLAAWLQPLVQIAASVPATALFPVALRAVRRDAPEGRLCPGHGCGAGAALPG
jgi:NitT/TauT family transport system permease protein